MAAVEDLAGYFSTSDFAVDATLAGAAVQGIFDASYYEPMDGSVQSSQPTFLTTVSAAPSVAHGQSLVVGSATYKIRGVEPDGTGLVMLRLELQ